MLLHVDSFDHYATADILRKWNGGTGTIAAVGRHGTNGLRTNNNEVSKTVPQSQTLIVGVAVKLPAGYVSDFPIFILRDGVTDQVGLWGTSSYTLRVKRGGTTLATGTTVLSVGVSYYIELKVKVDNTTGTTEVHINSVVDTALTLTGQDTQNTANAWADAVVLGNVGFGANQDYDDLYICNSAGSVNNDFLGDIRAELLLPTGAGATTQWTPSAGSNYQNVDDATPDDDTTYNSEPTVGDVDTYAFSNITPTTGTVKAVQTVITARKDDAGLRSIADVQRPLAADFAGTSRSLSTSYLMYAEIHELNPATGVPWTIAEVNAAEFGVKVAA